MTSQLKCWRDVRGVGSPLQHPQSRENHRRAAVALCCLCCHFAIGAPSSHIAPGRLDWKSVQNGPDCELQAPKVSKGRWREGQLLPDGWDEMDVGQKAYQLWAGKRGVLFWANKAAYASVFIVVAGWILFRFVGPALGLYQLSNDFSSAPSP